MVQLDLFRRIWSPTEPTGSLACGPKRWAYSTVFLTHRTSARKFPTNLDSHLGVICENLDLQQTVERLSLGSYDCIQNGSHRSLVRPNSPMLFSALPWPLALVSQIFGSDAPILRRIKLTEPC